MAQVAFIKLTNDWATVESLITAAKGSSFTFDTSKTYQIECRGGSNAFLVEPASAPTANTEVGVMLDNVGGKIVRYKKSTNTLYARADKESWLNITVLGE